MDGDGTTQEHQASLSAVAIPLLKGVLYQDQDANTWRALLQLQSQVRDHMGVLGLELVLDEAEGYAFLRARPEEPDAEGPKLPRLVSRRPLSFPVSLLLALLRKRLLEADATGGDTRLVLSLEAIAEQLRLFLPDRANEAKLLDQMEGHVGKCVELGFLKPLKRKEGQGVEAYEVRRILKAYVDAQWLGELDAHLENYRRHLAGPVAEGDAHA